MNSYFNSGYHDWQSSELHHHYAAATAAAAANRFSTSPSTALSQSGSASSAITASSTPVCHSQVSTAALPYSYAAGTHPGYIAAATAATHHPSHISPYTPTGGSPYGQATHSMFNSVSTTTQNHSNNSTSSHPNYSFDVFGNMHYSNGDTPYPGHPSTLSGQTRQMPELQNQNSNPAQHLFGSHFGALSESIDSLPPSSGTDKISNETTLSLKTEDDSNISPKLQSNTLYDSSRMCGKSIFDNSINTPASGSAASGLSEETVNGFDISADNDHCSRSSTPDMASPSGSDKSSQLRDKSYYPWMKSYTGKSHKNSPLPPPSLFNCI